MSFLLLCLGLLGAGAIVCLALAPFPRLLRLWAPGGLFLAFLAVIPVSVPAFSSGAPGLETVIPWNVPLGSFHLKLDALSAFFLLLVLLLSCLTALYGTGYLKNQEGRRNLGFHWFFFYLLTASMALVVTARNSLLFLVAWELMTLASYFLVTFEHEKREVRRAGLLYLIASHVGTAFLLVFFLSIGDANMNFVSLPPSAAPPHWLFLCALIGFGTKAGLVPLHIWLPEAHPAAPSHVSALMSGVLIKMGIYGLVRALTLLGPPPASWGYVLVGVGVLSGVLGVLLALAQHDLKRLLAYHSVENIGIITLGLGLGCLGWSYHLPFLACLGFAGGLLHVMNHALFKGLLFLGAGSVVHGTGTREMDHLGGLIKRMPWTAFTFLIGSTAICGLPPLNGFTSEFLLFFSGFKGLALSPAFGWPAFLSVVAGLGLIGGLACACFAKVMGVVFLGQPRGPEASQARECGPAMRIPMVVLSLVCLFLGLVPFLALSGIVPVVSAVLGLPSPFVSDAVGSARDTLEFIFYFFIFCLLILALLAAFRRWGLPPSPAASDETWGCGYLKPTARMQYTASSFAQPFTRLLQLFTRKEVPPLQPVFPKEAHFSTHPQDPAQEGLYRPLFNRLKRGAHWGKQLQHGSLRVYLLYISLTLLALFVWNWWRP